MIYVKKGALIKRVDESSLEKYKANGFSEFNPENSTEEPKAIEGEKFKCPHCSNEYKEQKFLGAHIAKKHPNGSDANV